MKNKILWGVSFLLLASSFLNVASADEEEVQALVVDNGSGSVKGNKKSREVICHKGRTIEVNANSKQLAGHLVHGDELGECSPPTPPPA